MNTDHKQAATILRNVLTELVELLDSDRPIDFTLDKFEGGLCAYVHDSIDDAVGYGDLFALSYGIFRRHLTNWAELTWNSPLYPIDDGSGISPYAQYTIHHGTDGMWRGTAYAKQRRKLIDYLLAEVNKELQS